MEKNRDLGRARSLVIVTVAYILAGVLGVCLCRALEGAMPFWAALLAADIAATVLVFIGSVIMKNASMYDPYWSVQPIVILAALAVGRPMSLPRALVIAAVTVWGVRLTANWVYTFPGLHHQDWRYTMLRERTGRAYPLINFLGIHLVPTLIVYGCIWPGVCVLREEGAMNAGVAVFFALALGAVCLQGTADAQMHRFRAGKTGGLIRDGLWKYARHPNYLAEISIWWCVGLLACCALGLRWDLLAGAAANTLLFLLASIPMADERQSAKPGYVQYRRETRMLLPLPRLR